MSSKKRMGNDPFADIISFTQDKQSESSKSLPAKKNRPMNNSPEKKTSASYDEAGEIFSKLNQAIAGQKEEIVLLRKELNELKLQSNYNKYNPFVFWLRFWFPWFPFK